MSRSQGCQAVPPLANTTPHSLNMAGPLQTVAVQGAQPEAVGGRARNKATYGSAIHSEDRNTYGRDQKRTRATDLSSNGYPRRRAGCMEGGTR